MLIRNAEVWGHGLADVRVAHGRIAMLAPPGTLDGPGPGTVDARGGALLPGLHDHHLHLAGLAARAASVWCGPPEVINRAGLQAALCRPGSGWLRGIGYHESVMGLPDARAIDALVADRAVRIQHRSGRMWLLNSAALSELLASTAPPPGLEREGGRFTGRLFDEDDWLRTALGSSPPGFAAISASLAAMGVTGVTDMSPRNDPAMAAHFASEIAGDALVQHCVLAGSPALAEAKPDRWTLGPVKLHLHEAALPGFDEAVALVEQAHRQDRAVAVHCVSEVELVFALAAIEAAGPRPGDRIEHASVASPDLVDRMASAGLRVCVQPHFIAERGDRYLVDVEPRHVPDLYRLRSLADAGIALAGGSDAPFGGHDPWASMRAAVDRRTMAGAILGAGEALSPEEALALYLADPADLGILRAIRPGDRADLCLLSVPWKDARSRLLAEDVRATVVSGRLVHQRVDEAPL